MNFTLNPKYVEIMKRRLRLNEQLTNDVEIIGMKP